jgi:hypothetical protein
VLLATQVPAIGAVMKMILGFMERSGSNAEEA